jgi:hypothetical protein
LQGVVQYALGPRLQIDARLGPSIVNTKTDLQTAVGRIDESDTNLAYSADVGIRWDATSRTETSLRFLRAVEPSGGGSEVVERSIVTLSLTHDLTRHLSFFADAYLQRDQSVSGDDESQDRDYVRLEPGLRWARSERVDLSARYRFRYQTQQEGGRDVTSNAFLVRLEVDVPDLRTSW